MIESKVDLTSDAAVEGGRETAGEEGTGCNGSGDRCDLGRGWEEGILMSVFCVDGPGVLPSDNTSSASVNASPSTFDILRFFPFTLSTADTYD